MAKNLSGSSYLQEALGDVLAEALVAVARSRPADPVGFVANFLRDAHSDKAHNADNPNKDNKGNGPGGIDPFSTLTQWTLNENGELVPPAARYRSRKETRQNGGNGAKEQNEYYEEDEKAKYNDDKREYEDDNKEYDDNDKGFNDDNKKYKDDKGYRGEKKYKDKYDDEEIPDDKYDFNEKNADTAEMGKASSMDSASTLQLEDTFTVAKSPRFRKDRRSRSRVRRDKSKSRQTRSVPNSLDSQLSVRSMSELSFGRSESQPPSQRRAYSRDDPRRLRSSKTPLAALDFDSYRERRGLRLSPLKVAAIQQARQRRFEENNAAINIDIGRREKPKQLRPIEDDFDREKHSRKNRKIINKLKSDSGKTVREIEDNQVLAV